MNATINDLYAALKQAVMFSPQYVVEGSSNGKPWKCRQLQTFRVMQKERGGDITAPNMGATICDKSRPFFWSRQWHENKYNPNKITFAYPALVLTELSFQVDRPFQKQTKRCYNFQLAVIDQLPEDCKDCNCESCEKRTVNEVFADTEALLFDAAYYVSQLRYAVLDPGGESGVWNTAYLEAMKERGDVNEYRLGADFGGLISAENKGASAYRVAVEATKIYGTALNFTACFHNCEATEPNFNLPDFGVLAREAGCSTCG